MSATYADGYRATAVCFVVGPDSLGKVQKTAESIIERTRAMFKAMRMDDFTDVNVQVCPSVCAHKGSQNVGPHIVHKSHVLDKVTSSPAVYMMYWSVPPAHVCTCVCVYLHSTCQ